MEALKILLGWTAFSFAFALWLGGVIKRGKRKDEPEEKIR